MIDTKNDSRILKSLTKNDRNEDMTKNISTL